jgi:hypothetical protein
MKLNNKILALLIVFIAIVSISAVSAEDVATDDVLSVPVDDAVVVEASDDADNVLGASYDVPDNANVSEIEAIIANTSAGDTLNFAANGTYDFGNNSVIEITHTLILQGNNATIKGYQGFLFEADEESVAGSQVYNLNFEVYQPVLWNGRALDFEGGSDYVIENCSFRNGNSGIYIRRPSGNVTINNNYFFADEGATNASTIKKDWGKQETGSKAINLMGGTGITITNNTFVGDYLDAVSIASGAANVEMRNNCMNYVWYGVFYGGGITNITATENTFLGSKAFAMGIIKAAGNSEIYNNDFFTPENETAIYVQEGNTAHGAPSNIETIHIYENRFLGENVIAVAGESQGGMITPKGEFVVTSNEYEGTLFAFNDNNTYSFTTNNFVSEDNHIYIEGNTVIKPEIGEITIDSESINATLAEDATGYLLIDVDGIGYYVPVEDGEATFAIPTLEPGNYTVVATYTGDANYETLTETANITIEEPPETIISEDLTKIEKSPDKFEATFVDADGKALANTEVEFKLNSGSYKRTTDANGTASMAINLMAGEYSISMTNPVTGEVKENTIIVLPRIISEDLTKYYKNESQFVVTVLDDEGNPVKAGEVVTFNINGVLYNRTTDANGTAKISINLPAQNYTVTTEYKGCKAANNIEVLPIITASDLTKKYGEATPFEATLVDGQGNPYANQEVVFNINGVMYKRMTGADGVAKLNINLQAGEYIITSSFNGFNTANKVTITA